ncbi:hypothetical protein [Pseudoclavibacter sp. JSM 162008]|uniref:hypothetical protein n=1 Tax=Pseudoclavibacter sp. JSM 162008 TaxID=3229855 RepID=UPI003524645D
MSDREVPIELRRRIIAAVYAAGASREAVEFEWPECHTARCSLGHPGPDAAFGIMKHQIAAYVENELRFESTTRPDLGDVEEHGSERELAELTLGVLLMKFARTASSYANAAALILDAYPDLVPVLAAQDAS